MQSRDPKSPKPLVVVLPGNPGVAELYRELAQDLEAGGHEVVVASHPALFDPAAGLMPYARHHATAALQHLQASARTADDVEVVLVGHSVGAYLAYLIATRGLLPVARVIMVFPFLARPVLSGRLILRAAACRPLFGVLIALFRALPARAQRWLVEAAGAGAQTAAVLRALASPLPFACGAMARVEHAEIAARPDATYLLEEPWFADRSRLAVMLCPDDRWVSPAVVRQLAPLAHRFDPPMGHSLVVDPDERRRVTGVLLGLLAGEATMAVRPARARL